MTDTSDNGDARPRGEEQQDDEITPRQKASAERAYQNERPDDNPFTELVDQLREDGRTFSEIIDKLDEMYDVVGDAAFQEQSFLVPDWQVTVLVDDPNTPSGKRYETHTRTIETSEEAEEMVERHTGWPVDSEQTELVGYSEVA